jgi:hypothetical protein
LVKIDSENTPSILTYSLNDKPPLLFDYSAASISPLSNQSAALVCRNLELLDRLFDRRLLVRLIVDNANELSRRPADMVDGPGVVALLPLWTSWTGCRRRGW